MDRLQWWIPAEWCPSTSSENFLYSAETGRLEIKKTGLYYVFAQVKRS